MNISSDAIFPRRESIEIHELLNPLIEENIASSNNIEESDTADRQTPRVFDSAEKIHQVIKDLPIPLISFPLPEKKDHPIPELNSRVKKKSKKKIPVNCLFKFPYNTQKKEISDSSFRPHKPRAKKNTLASPFKPYEITKFRSKKPAEFNL